MALFRDGNLESRQVLRIGAVATLSRNFQESFVEPLLQREDVSLVLQSGGMSELLTRLAAHNIDLVLSNRRVVADAVHPWRCQRITRQPVSLIGKPRAGKPFRFPEDMKGLAVMLPGPESELRTGFDLMCEQRDIRVRVLAEVDDMAMLRVLARVADAPVLVPAVVVRDELRQGILEEYAKIPNLYEDFYAISIKRQYQHPLIKALLARKDIEILS
jgi:LysR family transcriptional activator of nhaA